MFYEILNNIQTIPQVTGKTPQSEASHNTPTPQIENSSGGFVFEITKLQRLERFLILGTTESSVFYKDNASTKKNMDSLFELIKENEAAALDMVVDVSVSGRARNNDYALLVLAVMFTKCSPAGKLKARKVLPKVARTGTHLLHFVAFATELRGWGNALKKAVADWYLEKTPENLAYQVLKYRNRDKWTQRDLLRLSHPKAKDPVANSVLKYVTRNVMESNLPKIVEGYEKAKTASGAELANLVTNYGLPMEMVPTTEINDHHVLAALVPNLGATALLRNLNRLSAQGLIPGVGTSEHLNYVLSKFSDKEYIKKARLHPLQILVAKRIYEQGYGDKGSLFWSPNQNVASVLEEAFYLSFDTIEPSGLVSMKALDVSTSMRNVIPVCRQLSAREVSAVMAMVSLRAEKNSYIYGFSHSFVDLGLNRTDSLNTVIDKITGIPFGNTDCAMPMIHALDNGWDIDCFEIYTDNETWVGAIHPFEALKRYRKGMNKPHAKLAVIATSSTNFSIADPSDAGMMDFVGFDTSTPAALSAFARMKM